MLWRAAPGACFSKQASRFCNSCMCAWQAGRAGSEEGEGLPKTSITSKGMVLDDDVELMRWAHGA